jgi:hypothetical protein
MRRLIALATVAAMFATPVMAAKGQIKAKPPAAGQVIEPDSDVDGDKVEKPTKVEIYFRTCKDARAAGYSQMNRGEPGYAPHLDRDNDGIACE